jgi:aminopeptidase N
MVYGINVSVFYIQKSEGIWENHALEYTEAALILFNDSFGEYPYPTLNVVEEYTIFGGMEYPLQVYITEQADYKQYPSGYLESVIVHETAHQWFYQLIGNDEVDAGFIDEGLASWALDYYLSKYHPDWDENGAFSQLKYIKNYYNDVGLPNKINQSVYESVESGSNYWYTAYSKTPIILEKLRKTIGHDNFLNGLRLLFERFQFKNVWLSDVQEAFEDAVGSSLNWFFFPWFDNALLPNYAFSEVSYDMETGYLSLKIEDVNQENHTYEYSQKMSFLVYDESDLLILDTEIWVNGTTSLNISLSEKPGKIELEYSSFVLAQVTGYDVEGISTENILINNDNDDNGTIPGYSVEILIFFTVVALGFGLFCLKIKFKRTWE